MNRRGRVQVLTLILFAAIGFGVFLLWLFGPYYITFIKMRELCKSVVLDWAGLNEGKAHRRMLEEFHRQEIPDYVTLDNCEFKTDGGNKIVDCSWEVDVYYPYTQYYKTLDFDVLATYDGIEATVE